MQHRKLLVQYITYIADNVETQTIIEDEFENNIIYVMHLLVIIEIAYTKYEK